MFTYPICPPPCRFNTTPRRLLVAYLFKMARIKAFQHTAARRRLVHISFTHFSHIRFNTQPPEGGWAAALIRKCTAAGFNTQPPEGGWHRRRGRQRPQCGFNTQPPEGGWRNRPPESAIRAGFNTQPPEGGWTHGCWTTSSAARFQHTAARRRLGRYPSGLRLPSGRFNTQPPEGGWGITAGRDTGQLVSTHSRPKAAGARLNKYTGTKKFQHTAARRRLEVVYLFPSHPTSCFNTQPPEGGWGQLGYARHGDIVSTHSRPKAAGRALPPHHPQQPVSTHSRPKAAGRPPCFITVIVVVSTHSRPKAAGRGKR